MPRKVEHEITLLAFAKNEDGTISISDIVETSRHFASHFARKWVRDPEVSHFKAYRPNADGSINW